MATASAHTPIRQLFAAYRNSIRTGFARILLCSMFAVIISTGLSGCTGKGSSEVYVLFGVIAFLAYVPVKTILLGIITALVGAFLPSTVTESQAGKVSFSLGANRKFTVGGTLRFAVVSIGLIVVVGAIFQGADNLYDARATTAAHVGAHQQPR